ncbi:uncharacterized protein [Primulina eburnea]|uniref:uncharacterized protein n=1 Tax=Primulina eburnea TaxID=1245227 RepID=UPI003C6C85EC
MRKMRRELKKMNVKMERRTRDLDLGEVKPTTITLQLADRSLTYPRGIVEDVLVKVDKFIFPADFVILDMEEDQDSPLIFGRPFLAPGKALIDVHKGELTLRVGGEAVIFNIYKAIKGNDEDFPRHICYAFLGEKSTYPVIISSSLNLDEKEKLLRVLRKFKTAFGWSISDIKEISPTICMNRILMEELYAPYVDHQRRLNPAMKEVVKNEVLKLLNVGVIYAISDSSWVSPVQVVPKKGGMTVVKNENDELISTRIVTGWRMVIQRCQEKNLVLNWEKCHFMVQEGTVLGHKVSSKGLEVDKAKVVAIENLPPPKNIKGIRSFLGHAGFYRRFIKDFSKITKPLCNLLEKESNFIFDDDCLQAFEKIKKALVTTPIMIVPYWKEPFELMCDASDYAVGVVLGQRRDKFFRSIYYASRTMDAAQQNYTTTEKEMLAVVFAFDNFRPYLVDLIAQRVDFEVKDRKGCENQVADHLSRLKLEDKNDEGSIKEAFPDEQLFEVNSKLPWFADIANFLSCDTLPPDLNYYQKKKFFHNVKFYLWDDPYVFKRCTDKVIRRCVDGVEAQQILEQCHSSPYGGHFAATRTTTKVEAITTNTNDARVVAKFVHKNIFTRLRTPRAIISDEGTDANVVDQAPKKAWES